MFIKKTLHNKLGFFREENGKNIPKMKDDLQENGQILVMENLVKSWNFKSSKEYEPCMSLTDTAKRSSQRIIMMSILLTATEKQKHLGTRFNRSGMDLSRASLTLPKKAKKPSPDTISLIDSASSMESLSTAGLLGSKQLSSSLLNINESGGI